MFRWFFGDPKEKEAKDYNWLMSKLNSPPKRRKELDSLITDMILILKRLKKDSLKIYLKEEDIIEKCKSLDIDVRNHQPVSQIERTLSQNENKLRENLDDLEEALYMACSEIARQRKEKKILTVEQEFNEVKEWIMPSLKNIKDIMEVLTASHEFLKDIHLTEAEIEFASIEKKGKDLISFGNKVLMYADIKKKHILLKDKSQGGDSPIRKYNLRSSTSLEGYRAHLYEFGGQDLYHGTQFWNRANHKEGGFESIEKIHEKEFETVYLPDNYKKQGMGRFRFFKMFNFITGEDLAGNIDGKGVKYKGINVFMRLYVPKKVSDIGIAEIHGNPRNEME